jgi:repressor LexA
MITKQQKFLLNVLNEMVKRKGYFPTTAEIAFRMRLSSLVTVQSYLNRLFEKGYLEKTGEKWELPSKIPTIPLVGYVPAGTPHEIFESLGEEVELPDWMLDQEGEIVGFKVKGNSMIDAYIQEGDVVVIKKTPSAEPREMVVAQLEDSSITLKRLRKDNNRYWLSPENPEYPPIYEEFRVIGKVVGVLRKYK